MAVHSMFVTKERSITIKLSFNNVLSFIQFFMIPSSIFLVLEFYLEKTTFYQQYRMDSLKNFNDFLQPNEVSSYFKILK